VAVNVQVFFDDSQANVIFKELLKRDGPTPVKKAMVRGINDSTLAKLRGSPRVTPLRAARDAIYRQANLKKSRINRGTRVLKRDKARIGQNKPVGKLTANLIRISLTTYGARLRGGKRNKRIQVATHRGQARSTIPGAFIQRAGRPNSKQVLKRKPGVGRKPIIRLSGPSMGHWMTTRQTAKAVTSVTREFVPNRIQFHMQRELNGTAQRARAARTRAIANARAARAGARRQQQRSNQIGRALRAVI